MEENNVPKKSGVERQAEVLATALEKALQNGGVLVNSTQKKVPGFYGKGLRVNPVNQLIMALHSDAGEFKTNQYTTFNAAHDREEAVRKGQKGVPFIWTNTNEFVNKSNPEDKISRAQYRELSDDAKKDYQVNPKEDTYTLFNIDQTTMPQVHKEEYAAQLKDFGTAEERNNALGADNSAKEDKALRIDVNQFILNVRDNLVPIRKDGTGIAHYDAAKDTVHIPAQKTFDSYPDYVQETARQVIHATGIPQRLGREGVVIDGKKAPTEDAQVKEILVEELASAVKMIDFGLPAKIRHESLDTVIPKAIEQLKENPQFAEAVFNDVNRTIGMIRKAENGEKINLITKPSEKRQMDWSAQFPIDKVPQNFERVGMLKDDEGKWTLYAKPENGETFAAHPSKEDVGMYFDMLKNDANEEHLNEFKTQFAQKYYSVLANDQSKAVPLFKSNASEEALALITKVNAFKTKDSKILLIATIGDEKQKPVEVSQAQWQRLWLADDKRDYKTHLAAVLYSDVLAGKLEEVKRSVSPEVEGTKQHEEKEHQEYHQELDAAEKQKQEEQKRQNSPEAKEKKRQEEKAKEEATKQATVSAATIALTPMLRQFLDLKKKHPDALLLFRCGDFYETYSQDAEKASKILGITLTKSSKTKDIDGKPLAMAGFPYHALDTYLPKLIRAGQRVAICDQIEAPRQSAKNEAAQAEGTEETRKQEVKEVVSATKTEEQHHGMHR